MFTVLITRYLQQFFKAVPRITSYHHLEFSKFHPGTIKERECTDSAIEDVNIFSKKGITLLSEEGGGNPTQIVPKALDPVRRW